MSAAAMKLAQLVESTSVKRPWSNGVEVVLIPDADKWEAIRAAAAQIIKENETPSTPRLRGGVTRSELRLLVEQKLEKAFELDATSTYATIRGTLGPKQCDGVFVWSSLRAKDLFALLEALS